MLQREELSFQLLPFGLPGHSKVVLSLLQCDDHLADLDQVEGLRDERSGVGPIISSAMVAAIGTGDAFSDFAAWLGLVPKQISTGDSHHPRQDIETRQSLPVLTARGRRL
jgi:transposase